MNDLVFRFSPKVFLDNDTAKVIYNIQKKELEKVIEQIKILYNNTNINTCDRNGIMRWLNSLGLEKTGNLETDKLNCLTKFSSSRTLNFERLNEILISFFGEDNYVLELDNDRYELLIDVLGDRNVITNQHMSLLRDIIPANILLLISTEWMHLYLQRNYTHEELEQFTFGELSKYAKEDE